MHVELTRGGAVESVHRVEVVVADHDGPRVVWGDGDRPVIPRSALKFIQAMPLLSTGAAEAFGLSDIEVALACASHSGEPSHVDAVVSWLDRLDLDHTALACGPDLPIDQAATAELYRLGLGPGPVFNGCSGKHTGYLTVARHLGVDPAGYIEPDHPVQRLVTGAIEQLTGLSLRNQRPGRDGCGVPTYAIALSGLARAMARLVSPDGLDPALVPAARRLIAVPEGRQFWISGTGRREVLLGDAIAEPLLAKIGAEGVFMVGLPERGLGIALKAADGAGRAAECAVSATLAWLGILDAEHARWPVTNKAGTVVGELSARISTPSLNRL